MTNRFEKTGRDVGVALGPVPEFTRGHPQRGMILAALCVAADFAPLCAHSFEEPLLIRLGLHARLWRTASSSAFV